MKELRLIFKDMSSPEDHEYMFLSGLCVVTFLACAWLHDVELSDDCKKVVNLVLMFICFPAPIFWVTTTSVDTTAWYNFWSDTTLTKWVFHVFCFGSAGVLAYTAYEYPTKIPDNYHPINLLSDYITMDPKQGVCIKFINMLPVFVCVVVMGYLSLMYEYIVVGMTIAAGCLLVTVHGFNY